MEGLVQETLNRLAQLEAQNREMATTIGQHQQALAGQTQRSEAAEAALREAKLRVELLQANAAVNTQGGATVRSAVDTRTLGKPQSFNGRREGWREFRFVFEAFACAAHPQLEQLFRRAETMNDMTIDFLDLDKETAVLSRQLYYMLVMLTTDDAHRMMINIEQGNGVEAWRRMCWEYEPNVRVRHGAVLHGLLRREFGKDANSDLAVEIETFERDVRRWEEQSGKTLDSDIKTSILMGNMANARVRGHLELNAARLDNYTAVRSEILNFAVAKLTWNQEPSVHDDPMVIGAVKGKGKKGKKGKDGKGKDGTDGKGKSSSSSSKTNDNPAAGKECHYCKKVGHFKADCRKYKADLAAGKVDNKGKGNALNVKSITNEVPETAPTQPTPSPCSWPQQQWYPVMMPPPVPMAAVRQTPIPTLASGHQTAISHDAPWMIMMIQPPRLVAADWHGEHDLALVDSGSGVVACPRDYAPEGPLLPHQGELPPMVSATSEPIQFYGRKIVH